MTHMTLEQQAQHYVAVLRGPANGWGQYCDPVTGERSDYIMRRMIQEYGERPTRDAIDEALKHDRP